MWNLKRSLTAAVRAVLTPRGMLVGFVLVSTLLGLTRFNRYGESWDEQVDFQYGEDAAAYYGGPDSLWLEYGNLRNYGPAYLAFAHSVAAHMLPLVPGWQLTDARHFVNHLTLQVATVSLFYLCLRYVGGWASLGATLLFATQPLLFGHSFINQKDAPFMAGFLLAVTLGLKLGDGARRTDDLVSEGFRGEWRRTSRVWRVGLIASGLLAGLACVELLGMMRVVLPAILTVVGDAYRGQSVPLVNEWFLRLAQEASRLPAEAYLRKAASLYTWFRWPMVAVAAIPFVGLTVRTFRSSLSRWWDSEAGLLLMSLGGGAVAGLTMATRVIGIGVLGLVGLAVILRRGRSGLPALGMYVAAAVVASYAAWPYLHAAPLGRFWESISLMSQYPWGGGILYRGDVLHPETLPWDYVPSLLCIQLTLPALLLGVAGVPLMAVRALKSKEHLPAFLALLAWFSVPVVAVIVLRSTLYNNFRQLLFIMPPLFVFAGVSLEAIGAMLRSPVVGAVLAVAILMPGIVGIIRLHPYEYVYYNGLVGGTRGAFRAYEMDYWCTSYREGMVWINAMAPAGAQIAVAPPMHIAQRYARPDLQIIDAQTPGDLGGQHPVYGLGCGRGNNDLGFFPEYSVAHEVAVQGVRLAVIRDFRVPVAGSQD